MSVGKLKVHYRFIFRIVVLWSLLILILLIQTLDSFFTHFHENKEWSKMKVFPSKIIRNSPTNVDKWDCSLISLSVIVKNSPAIFCNYFRSDWIDCHPLCKQCGRDLLLMMIWMKADWSWALSQFFSMKIILRDGRDGRRQKMNESNGSKENRRVKINVNDDNRCRSRHG